MEYLDGPPADLPLKLKPLTKQPMAVLSGPIRSFGGWAQVKTSKLSRSTRRYISIRSSKLTVCATENPRSQILSIPVTGATMLLTSNRSECLIRTSLHRLCIQWPSEGDLRICKAAVEFSNRHVDDYYKLVTHRQLGKGRNSEVIFAFDTATGDHAAVKIVNKDKARPTDREFAEKEVLIRMTVQHPCVVQTLDIFETPYDLFIVMELMNGGSLDRRMHKYNEPITEHEARIVMCRLFSALRHLHLRNIVHRNVKPQNIYLDGADDVRWPYTVKLADFSLSCSIDDPDASKQVVGTPEYLAPCATIMTRTESGERGVVFGTEVDMWAAGVTLYNLLSMQLPFEGENPSDVFKQVRLGRFSFTDDFVHVSDEAKSLIRSLLNVDRRKQPTADTVMLHKWFEPLHDAGEMNGEQAVLDDGTLTGAPSVFECYGEYALSDGVRRFRSAVTAVRLMVRLSKKSMSGRDVVTRKRRGEKRFQFNVSGIDIAPMDVRCEKSGLAVSAEDTTAGIVVNDHRLMGYVQGGVREVDQRGKDSGDGNMYVMQGRASGTVMSRVSTGSTVRSRSSRGTDSGGNGVPLMLGKVGMAAMMMAPTIGMDGRGKSGFKLERSDSSVDYFGHGYRRRDLTGTGDIGPITETHRLLSDTADLVEAEEEKAMRRRWRKGREKM